MGKAQIHTHRLLLPRMYIILYVLNINNNDNNIIAIL